MRATVLRCGLGGAVLGLATFAACSFVGVPVVPTGTHRAARTALHDALLAAEDLPAGFVAEVTPLGPAPADGCEGLVADPAAGWVGAVKQGYRQPDTGAQLWEAVGRPAGDALADLRARLAACAPRMAVQGLPATLPDALLYELGPIGYLAAARAHGTVLVLRYVGPGGPPTAATLLRTALDKLDTVPG